MMYLDPLGKLKQAHFNSFRTRGLSASKPFALTFHSVHKLTLRVQSTQICSIYCFSMRNRNNSLGYRLHIWVLGPLQLITALPSLQSKHWGLATDPPLWKPCKTTCCCSSNKKAHTSYLQSRLKQGRRG